MTETNTYSDGGTERERLPEADDDSSEEERTRVRSAASAIDESTTVDTARAAARAALESVGGW